MKPRVAQIINHEIALRVHGRNYFIYLRSQGYDLDVVCSPGQVITADGVNQDGFFVKAIPFPSRYTVVRDLKSFVQLVRFFRQRKYDIVHTHTVKPGLLGRVAARLAGVPIVIHTVHGFHHWDDMSALENRIFVWIERFAARFCDSLLFQNREDMAFAERERICGPEKIHYLGNGIDITRFRPDVLTPEQIAAKRRELGVAPGEKLVGMIGRLVRLKGYYEYVEAARILHEQGYPCKFLSIGESHDKAATVSPNELIAQHGLQDSMQFLGVRNDIPELMSAMDVIILASYAEGIPRVLLEAAAVGKPAVGTDVRGTREVIVDGETGILVPVRDAPALARGIARLLSDPQRRTRMGQAAYRRAQAEFDERLFFRRTDQEYRRLIRANLSAHRLRGLNPVETQNLASLQAGGEGHPPSPAGKGHVEERFVETQNLASLRAVGEGSQLEEKKHAL